MCFMSENRSGEFVRGFRISLHPFWFLVFSGNEASCGDLLEEQQQPYNHFQSKSKVPLAQDVNFISSQSQENPPTLREAALSTGVVKSIICTEFPVIPTSLPPALLPSPTDNLPLTYFRLHSSGWQSSWVFSISCDSTSFYPPVFWGFFINQRKTKTRCLFSLLLPVSTVAVAASKQENTRCCSATFPTLHSWAGSSCRRFHFKLIGKKLLQQWRTPKRGFLLLLFL